MNRSSEYTGFCPDCGAENTLSAQQCWLCGRKAWVRPAAADESVSVTVIPEPAQPERWLAESAAGGSTAEAALRPTFSLALLFVVVTLIATFFGIWSQSPGLAVLFAVVVGPALLATVVKSRLREVQARPMTSWGKVGTFLSGVTVMLASVAAVIGVQIVLAAVFVLALAAALLLACSELLAHPP